MRRKQSVSVRAHLRQSVGNTTAELAAARRAIVEKGPAQIRFWLIALGIGIAAGLAAMAFRIGIEELQALFYGTEDVNRLRSFAETLHWSVVLLIPVLGGIAVGLILHFFTPDGRVRAVADVIEGAALGGGRVEIRAGIASAFASLITLSTGGSTGREGPVVHMAGVISTLVASRLKADGIKGRDLLGCAVAAAVSASFNAPIAGALFALEVVLRHFALHAFAPIVIASVAGTVISRLVFGDVTEFTLPGFTTLEFYFELPAYLLLGLICGLVAAIMMRSVLFADRLETTLQHRLGLPYWLRPSLAGLLLGLIAIWFPHIIGVGYETTSDALTGRLGLREVVLFAMVKVAAVAITMAGRLGGGIFSPSLMVGALTGLAFGLIATSVVPEMSSGQSLYALAGMGAVAAAVLGAPISTTLIVFELTGDWQTGIAVMVSVSLSTALSAHLVERSFFLNQLALRGVHLAAGPQAYLLAMFRAKGVMRRIGTDAVSPEEEEEARVMISNGVFLDGSATLDVALPLFDKTGAISIPVVDQNESGGASALIGVLYHVDALRQYNRALAAISREEHS